MDTTGTFRTLHDRELSGRKSGNLKDVGLGGLAGVEKILVLDGGRKEMVVNSCFEDLEGRRGLKRVWEFIPKVGKKRNEKVKVSSDS